MTQLLDSCRGWFAHHLAWSNSRRSWEERVTIGFLLATAAYTAGAISEEKEHRTLEYLLATDLRNREIVLGKLASRLANLALLVVAGLPVLSLLQFLGGVDPDLMLATFALTGLTMASL